MSHRCTVPSLLAAARVRPDGANATEKTCPCGPVRVAISAGWAGSARFHIQTVPSVTPAARVVPSGLNATAHAPPAAAALIRVAMDARRLGMGIGLPQVFLEAAAPWYLTDAEWEAEGEAWLEQALAHSAVPCKGVRGPLTRIRPHPARSGATGPGSRNGDEQLADGPRYRLADYLDQHRRHHRQLPGPAHGILVGSGVPCRTQRPGRARRGRGRSRPDRYAAQLYKNAAGSGNLLLALYLNTRRITSAPSTARCAGPSPTPRSMTRPPWPGCWTACGSRRGRAGHRTLHRDLAVHAGLDQQAAAARLLDSLAAAGVEDQVRALAERAVGRVPVRSPGAVSRLLNSLRSAGMQVQVIILAGRAIADAPLDDPSAVSSLVKSLRAIGDRQVTALLQRDPAAHVWLDDPTAVGELLDSLRAAGADQQAAALAGRAAAESPVDDTLGVTGLLAALREPEAFTVLAERAIAQVPRHDPAAVGALLISLREAGAQDQITTLLRQDPAAHAALHHADDVIMLTNSPPEAGTEDLVTRLSTACLGRHVRALPPARRPPASIPIGLEVNGSPANPWGWEIWKHRDRRTEGRLMPRKAGTSTDVVGTVCTIHAQLGGFCQALKLGPILNLREFLSIIVLLPRRARPTRIPCRLPDKPKRGTRTRERPSQTTAGQVRDQTLTSA